LCAAAPPMRARVRTLAGTRLRGAMGVGMAARREGSVHASEYIYYRYVCVCVPRLHLRYPFICICDNRPALCVRAPVCDGDGSLVCARVGGLVLRARPKTRNPNPGEPCPSASTASGFGAQAFYGASAFNANIGAWNTARVTTLSSVCAARGPAARTMADALGRGFGAARPVVRGDTADDVARVRTRVGTRFARGHGCRYGRAEGRFGTCIRI
jgi:surface protein